MTSLLPEIPSKKLREFYPKYVTGYTYSYRWLRANFLNLKKKNKRLRKGLSLVKYNKRKYQDFPRIKRGKLKGYIGVGGLVLCKIKIGIRRKI